MFSMDIVKFTVYYNILPCLKNDFFRVFMFLLVQVEQIDFKNLMKRCVAYFSGQAQNFK